MRCCLILESENDDQRTPARRAGLDRPVPTRRSQAYCTAGVTAKRSLKVELSIVRTTLASGRESADAPPSCLLTCSSYWDQGGHRIFGFHLHDPVTVRLQLTRISRRANAVPCWKSCMRMMEEFGMPHRMLADRKEHGLGALRRKRAEHGGRIARPRPVVEGQDDLARLQRIVALEPLGAEAGTACGIDFDSAGHAKNVTCGLGIAGTSDRCRAYRTGDILRPGEMSDEHRRQREHAITQHPH